MAEECRSRGAVRTDIIAVELGPSRNSAEVVEEAVSDSPTSPLVLVSCAGVAEFGPYAEMEWSAIEGSMATNLGVPLRMCHAILPHMLARGGGQIINVLSIAATTAFPGGAAYCSAKAGLHMFGRAIAADYRKQGIRVTSILPGSTDTPLWDKLNFSPEKSDMMQPRAVAEVIRDVVLSPPDRNLDEIVVMPPKGFL